MFKNIKLMEWPTACLSINPIEESVAHHQRDIYEKGKRHPCKEGSNKNCSKSSQVREENCSLQN